MTPVRRKSTLRRMTPTARKIATELDHIKRAVKRIDNLMDELQMQEQESRATRARNNAGSKKWGTRAEAEEILKQTWPNNPEGLKRVLDIMYPVSAEALVAAPLFEDQ